MKVLVMIRISAGVQIFILQGHRKRCTISLHYVRRLRESLSVCHVQNSPWLGSAPAGKIEVPATEMARRCFSCTATTNIISLSPNSSPWTRAASLTFPHGQFRSKDGNGKGYIVIPASNFLFLVENAWTNSWYQTTHHFTVLCLYNFETNCSIRNHRS